MQQKYTSETFKKQYYWCLENIKFKWEKLMSNEE